MSGTYNRLEVSPGRRFIDGTYPTSPRLTFDAEAGKVYFLRYTVRGGRNPTGGNLQRVGDQEGRALVAQATLFP